MSNEAAIDLLNDLLQHEARSLLPRLRESTVFVSWAAAGEHLIVERMIDEANEHRGWLVEAITRLGGDPLPGLADIKSASIHFLELDFVLPRVVESHRSLLAAYEAAASEASSHSVASEVVLRTIERHRKHGKQLEQLASHAKSATASHRATTIRVNRTR